MIRRKRELLVDTSELTKRFSATDHLFASLQIESDKRSIIVGVALLLALLLLVSFLRSKKPSKRVVPSVDGKNQDLQILLAHISS